MFSHTWIPLLHIISSLSTADAHIFQQTLGCSTSSASFPEITECWWRAAYNGEEVWKFDLLNSTSVYFSPLMVEDERLLLHHFRNSILPSGVNIVASLQSFMNQPARETVTPNVTVSLVDTEVGVPLKSLCCRVSEFYPPDLNVTWSLDGSMLALGNGLKEPVILPNSDGTFQTTSCIPFNSSHPQGKRYSCTVQHLSTPLGLVAKWEAPPPENRMVKAEMVIGILAGLAGIVFLASALIYHGCIRKGRISTCCKSEDRGMEISEIDTASEGASASA